MSPGLVSDIVPLPCCNLLCVLDNLLPLSGHQLDELHTPRAGLLQGSQSVFHVSQGSPGGASSVIEGWNIQGLSRKDAAIVSITRMDYLVGYFLDRPHSLWKVKGQF